MIAEELRALQEAYRSDPESAVVTLRAEGRMREGITCRVDTGAALVAAGLHPATGGNGLASCSGDMLLQALVACAGLTLGAVATALGIEARDAGITAEGDLDFRGTLGVSKEVPVGSVRYVSGSGWIRMLRTNRSPRSYASPSATAWCTRRSSVHPICRYRTAGMERARLLQRRVSVAESGAAPGEIGTPSCRMGLKQRCTG